jgi:hypothetical protein
VYAPALVAWTSGPAGSISVSFGSGIGWFPLGPREVYVPGYRYSRRYLDRVNVSNTIIVNNTYITNVYNGRYRNYDYRYGRNPHAVTIVDRDRFVGGRPLQGHFANFSEADLRRWNRDPRPPALAPSRDSVFASRVLGRIPGRSITDPGVARLSSQHVAANRGISRVPFEVERRQIEANGGRPIARSQLIRTSPRSDMAARSNELNRDLARGGRVPATTDGRARIERNDNDRNAIVQGQSVQPRSSTRALSDRPSWAARQREDQREDNQRRYDAANQARALQQRERADTRTESNEARQRANEDRANQWRRQQELRTNSSGDGSSINSLRRESPPGADRTDRPQRWRSDDDRERLRTSPVEQSRSYGSGSNDTSRREYRAPSSQPSRPQLDSPRYEPPRRAEQPQRIEQPRRYEQPRSEPRNVSPPSQPRSNNDNSNRGQDNGRSGNHSGRQGIQQQR